MGLVINKFCPKGFLIIREAESNLAVKAAHSVTGNEDYRQIVGSDFCDRPCVGVVMNGDVTSFEESVAHPANPSFVSGTVSSDAGAIYIVCSIHKGAESIFVRQVIEGLEIGRFPYIEDVRHCSVCLLVKNE